MSVLNLIRPELKNTIVTSQSESDTLTNRLHANELPWCPLPADTGAFNHYPDVRKQNLLQEQLARRYQVKSEQILVTRGSDDGIDALMRLFLSAGKNSILQCPPTFSLYAFYAQLQNAAVINCPLDESQGFGLSLKDLFNAWQPGCNIIMLCQPNNPTGNLLTLENIAEICDAFTNKAVVIVDEAYIEFAKINSATTLLSDFENLIILRTLSKAYGLAGLRIGSIIAQEPIITALQKTRAPYLLSSPVLDLALVALTDNDWFTTKTRQVLSARDQLISDLQKSPWIASIYPSHANFLLIKSPYAHALAHWFSCHDIAIRRFPNDGALKDTMRITVGSEAQNITLLNVLETFKG
ncbi:MAG: histidinol-phosphate transaminase [Legionella sp.]|nr:histidinol-phosphate transaminase [Legionella sp.]